MTGHLPRPMDAAAAKGIARAFLPERALGNRYDYYYTLTKLRTDPLYPGVLDALRGCGAPLLDLGCGLGLLAQPGAHDIEHRPIDAAQDVAPTLAGHVIGAQAGFVRRVHA